MSSLSAKSNHRIDARRTLGGNERRDYRHDRHQREDDGVGKRIAGADAEQDVLDSGAGDRGQRPAPDPGRGRARAPVERLPGAAPCSESGRGARRAPFEHRTPAAADSPRTTSRRTSPPRRARWRSAPKIENIVAMMRFCATKLSIWTFGVPTKYSGRFGSAFASCRRSAPAIPSARWPPRGFATMVANCAGERPRLDRADRVREEGHVEACLVHARLVERPEHSNRADHADDRPPRTCALRVAVRRGRSEAASDRALGAEVLLRERGVDDRDRLPRVEIVVGEAAAFEELLPGDREEASRSPARGSPSADRLGAIRACPRSPSDCFRKRPCGTGW